ncbi:uncharacterized protein E5676_scaffold639G00130 [Cucumis melo var. makuwa]|uniref:DUF4218 domain-containing protein n=1 Tax=Cucumis melo var. makuwa TaxID=1194695 RepID=A0A5A7UW94_CUCMM|nr:uncharacterized protein E6C27_scaffold22G00160 [Cucumis melo var. makuwa]TYJ97617.1 uncharacterized protein E5676_scaffold639G00130 [Cucumis melo var. makuwa]
MSLLIPGPRSSGKEIDVYLQPLLKELKELRTFGERTVEYKGVSGMSYMMGDRFSFGIQGRISFMGHRRYLPKNHVWHRSRLHDGKIERRAPPVVMNVQEILEQLDHWMYPIERSLHTLKKYVRNKAHSEVAEAYVMNESSTFCSRYLSGIETRFTRDERNDDTIVEDEVIGDFEILKQKVRGLGSSSFRTISQEEKRLFHWYILNNVDEISEYRKHERTFPEWFRAQVLELREYANLSENFFSLAREPSFDVRYYKSCIMDGLRFHTSELDSRHTTQNSGLMVIGESNASISEDNNFYDVLDDALHVQYPLGRNVWLFKCQWYDTDVNKSQRSYVQLGYKSINTSHFLYSKEPITFMTQAHQVFYRDDPKNGSNWKVVQVIQNNRIWDMPEAEDIENEQINIVEIVVGNRVDDHIEDDTLCRTDVDPTIVERSVVRHVTDDFIDDVDEHLSHASDDDELYCQNTVVYPTTCDFESYETCVVSTLRVGALRYCQWAYSNDDCLWSEEAYFSTRHSLQSGDRRFFVLDFNYQAMNWFVEHQMLSTFKEFRIDCHNHFKKYIDPEEAPANPPNLLVDVMRIDTSSTTTT